MVELMKGTPHCVSGYPKRKKKNKSTFYGIIYGAYAGQCLRDMLTQMD